MPDKPAAEVRIDEPLVRHLIQTQATDVVAPGIRPVHADEGWDCSVWRLGDAHAARLPRRAAAAALTVNEHRFLHPIADRLGAAELGCPVPLVHGTPDAAYPWAWSVVPWFDGASGLDVRRERRRGWAHRLARGVLAVHAPASDDYPRNPVRGVPLADRAEVVAGRFVSARAAARIDAEIIDALESAWRTGLDARAWDRRPVWIHGDLHPGNVVARGSDLVALIDFGDLTAGDPAMDLATAWLTFDAAGRSAFRAALDGHYDDATWLRARAWAAALAILLLQQSDDDPHYGRLAAETAQQIASDTETS